MKTPTIKKSVQSFLLVSAAYLAVPAQAAMETTSVSAPVTTATSLTIESDKEDSRKYADPQPKL